MSASTGGAKHNVIAVRDLTAAAYILRVERLGLKFRAGQCVTVGIPAEGINREYSTYSAEEAPYFDMLIREVERGLVSRSLRKCAPGTPLTLMGPYGSFVLAAPEDTTREYLFVATGTGIAPFHAFVQSFPGLRYTLLHGIRRLEDRYDYQDYDPTRYVACVTQEDGGAFRGRVTDYLRAHPVAPSTICYLCGNRAMLAEAFDILREQGVPGNNLFTEAFF